MSDISMLRSKCLINTFFNGCISWQYRTQVLGESFDTDSLLVAHNFHIDKQQILSKFIGYH